MADPNDGPPLLKVKLYTKASVPYFGSGSQESFVWHSCLSEEARYGTYSYATTDTGVGMPAYKLKTEYLGQDRIRPGGRQSKHEVPIGLVLTPFIIPQDVGTWSSVPGDGGTWESLRPLTTNAKLYLCQEYQGVNSSGTTTVTPWGKQSSFTHPALPDFAFTTLPLAVAPEYLEATGGTSYTQVGWSSGKWAIRFFHNGNPILFDNGVPVMELSQPGNQAHGDLPDWIVGIVRFQRGALCISLDQGASYDVYWDPAGSDVASASGVYSFTGRGCAATFGLHQVRYLTGAYDSPANYFDRPRANSPTLTKEGAAPTANGYTGTAVALTNLGTTAYAQYRATLTPGSITSHWAYYRSPEVYTVQAAYPAIPTTAFPVHDNGAQFEGRILSASIDEPREIDESEFIMETRWDQFLSTDFDQLMYRLVQVDAALDNQTGYPYYTLFTGFITDIAVTQQIPSEVRVTFTCQNTSLRPKRMRHRANNCRVFDGATVNAAFLAWVQDLGLDSTYIVTHARGDVVTLPNELPERPSFKPGSGDGRWEIMKKIADYSKMELGVTRTGNYQMVLADTWNATLNTWNAVTVAGANNWIDNITAEQHGMETYTGLEVQGRNRFGEQITVWLRDQQAEELPTSARFKPWPEWDIITPDWVVTPGWLNTAAQGVAYKTLVPQRAARWKGDFQPQIKRRDTAYITNTSVGIGIAPSVGVLTVRHEFDMESGNQVYTIITGVELT